MAGLLKELWIDLLIGDVDEFFDNDHFLSHGANMSYAVENDRINFTYKGPRPNIVKNFRTDGDTELDVYMRTDVADYVDLDNYSTEQMVLPRVDLFALPYDKKQSLLQDMRLALVDRIAVEGIWNIGPAATATKTPVISAATANPDAGDGYDAIVRSDITNLRILLDIQYPGLKNADWQLMVDSYTYWYLVNNDDILKAQYSNSAPIGAILSKISNGGLTGKAMGREPIPLQIAGFTLYCDDRTPWYKASDSTKFAYGATYTVDTDFKSAIAYVPGQTFCTALGSTELFEQNQHPGKQADLASFLTRAYIGPWGQTASNLKHAGAILRQPHS
ncbi:hypothetical protein [Flavilitoribacter nigricans]|uniref:Uncharacterized protein n=1 Tax=Flavilitoribacter nigricans (strain ATCC 23147 / DSM 23189 / NBRC 102662 / NCIMB 1420 / SS-2) TaxID=1122177 RepID=A0A2D0MWE4_FLAN2|nr:hypothetical protein [Flavilitoribacter nigricans]PHN00602.1 hypothetical protein CRP01_41350 [Flavilitoribacter nigricans DSM 23189 = NBRC 102662]